MNNKNILKSFKIAKKFKIAIKYTNEEHSYYQCGRTIYLSKNFTAYTVLHEIGHVLYKYGCCREHDEYIAHGIALGLAKAYNIKLPEYSWPKNKPNKDGIHCIIDYYAGQSSRRGCPAVQKDKKRKKK